MTQLSLFDSPVAPAAAVATVTKPSVRRHRVGGGQPRRQTVRRGEPTAAAAAVAAASPEQLRRADSGNREGLNRMGDLAKLVILRYELAAKRREEMIARRRAAVR